MWFPNRVQTQLFLPPDQHEALMQAVNCGVLAMDTNTAGLMSPSKTIAYLALGLSIVELVPQVSDAAARNVSVS